MNEMQLTLVDKLIVNWNPKGFSVIQNFLSSAEPSKNVVRDKRTTAEPSNTVIRLQSESIRLLIEFPDLIE